MKKLLRIAAVLAAALFGLPSADALIVRPGVHGFQQQGPEKPALDLDFRQGTLDSRIAYSGGANGTFFDSAGVLQTSGTDAVRFDHDPVTLVPLGILIEEARTNLSLQSEEFFSDPIWFKSPTLLNEVDSNTAVAPDGTTTMDTLRDLNLASVTSFRQNITVANDSLFHTFSIFILKDNDETRFPRIQLGYQLGAIRAAAYWINTKTGATFLQGAGTVTVEDHGLYWRMSCALDNNTTGNTKLVLVVEAAAGTVFGTIAVGATGEVTVWGAQLEKTSLATSYIKTTTAPSPRTADLVPMSDVSWYNAAEGTFFVEANDGGTVAGAFARLIELNDGADSDRLIMDIANGKPRIFVDDGSITQAALSAAIGVPRGETFRAAGAYKLNDVAVTSGGATVTTDSVAIMPDPTNFSFIIGSNRAATRFWNGHIARITYWNRRLPDERLQDKTGG